VQFAELVSLNSAVLFGDFTWLAWFYSSKSAFHPKASGYGRHSARQHSARSAFGPKMWSAFHPVGIQAASRIKDRHGNMEIPIFSHITDSFHILQLSSRMLSRHQHRRRTTIQQRDKVWNRKGEKQRNMVLYGTESVRPLSTNIADTIQDVWVDIRSRYLH